jgi:hypothetical protein
MVFTDCPACLDQADAGHDGRGDAPALRDSPGAVERKARRPSTAPAYYLGRRAHVWIAAMRARRAAGATAREFGTSGPPTADKKGRGHHLLLPSTFNV